MSGLAINGNTVHGLAMGGKSFISLAKNSDGTYTIRGKKFAQKSDLIGKTATYYKDKLFYQLNGESTADPSNVQYGAETADSKIVGICEIDGTQYVVLDQVWSTEGVGSRGIFRLSDVYVNGGN